ncbi:MAG TPA: hypothetical protein VNK48_07310 [Xanthobacteraceae bacterium]|nr:hypothetical protein [Xanthobacteraceae bacterium]
MSYPEWPAQLAAAPLREGYGEEPERNVAEWRPDVGMPRGRPRSIIESDRIEAVFLLSGAELDLFWSFYDGALQSGVLPFVFRDARSGVMRTFVFAGAPRARARSGAQDCYELAVAMRRLP